MAEVRLKTPIDEKDIRKLNVGDLVKITGTIYTARDAVHKYLLENLSKPMPFDLKGGILYHCGPVVEKVDGKWRMVAAGPTTSARISLYEPDVIEKYGVKAVIGKGGMNDKVLDANKKFGAVYLHAVGGAAQVLAECIKSVPSVYFLEEFGSPEAIWEMEVERFPAVVTMDAQGGSLHREIFKSSQAELAKRL